MTDHELAVTAELPGRAEEILSQDAATVRVHRGRPLTSESDLAHFIGLAHGVVTLLANPVTTGVFDACPNLVVVANCAVGFDNIDLEAALRRGVWVTNTPDVLTEATADLAWALILAVTRRVVEADALLRSGAFGGWALDLMLGAGLQGQRLGVIGFGRIGRAVAARGIAFGMEVVSFDPEIRPPSDRHVTGVDLETLLATSRVVTLHCPLTGGTHHLIDANRLALMRSDAVLINTARGPIIDEAALVAALAAGRIAGAGLDVFENEPAVHPGLIGRSDVVLLPHIGSATRETRAAMAELAATSAVAVLQGREPPTAVVRGRAVSCS
jgi:glyoxylate reductase